MWHDRRTYICISCRVTSKYSGQCPQCSGTFLAMYNFQPPRKRDDKGWKKVELLVLSRNSGLSLCEWSCCVPTKNDFNSLTLSQFKTRIRKRLKHRDDRVPQYTKFNSYR